jgi:Family of unknown function (DUF6188)
MSIETDDGDVIVDELVGIEVSEILLNGTVRMTFGENRRFELAIQRDFTLRSFQNPDGVAVEFRPYMEGWKPKGMDELVSLFHAVVTTAVATSDAAFRMSFADGRSLEVDVSPDSRYEAWHLWIDGRLFGQGAGSGPT